MSVNKGNLSWALVASSLLAMAAAAAPAGPTTNPAPSAWPNAAAAAHHWSFTAPHRPSLPAVKDAGWCRNPIDRFVLAKLESMALLPSPEASGATLLRRASLDLTGLPPSPKELDEFLADNSPRAYEKAVDRLLASPHYGERWGKHWLDAARYADSNGYSIDSARSMWRYRDWVIDATSRDMPFDQFTVEQIAGDLLPGATLDQKIATGFHRNTQINQEGGIDLEQFRVEAIVDRINTTGSVFLGLTIGCAQCHDHKFDPISQRDYYRFFAFFNQCDEPEIKTPVGDELKRQAEIHAKHLAALAQKKEADAHIPEKLADWEKSLTEVARAKLPGPVREALKVEPGNRDKKQQAAILAAFRAADPASRDIDKSIAALKKQEAEAITTTLVIQQRPTPRQTYIFTKGDFTRHGEVVTAGVPSILPQLPSENPTRLDLAHWIADPANPMTARVTVNRIWQHYFGAGIVETENDFGTQGTLPANQPLLDWLALEFVHPTNPSNDSGHETFAGAEAKAQPWSRKAMHRLIVTSATYRQSSAVRPELADTDPYNHLLARQSRVRLDAEVVRDVGLSASGLLCETVGGPSVFPPQPSGVMNLTQIAREWKASTGPNRYRRGLYTYLWRSAPHPLLTSFDATNGAATCTRRLRSNTPLQALILLNDEASLEFARAMALRLLRDGPSDDAARLELGFKLCTSRSPLADEKRILSQVLKKQLDSFTAEPNEADELALKDRPKNIDAPTLAAWTIVSRVMLNLDETITRE